MLHDTRMSATIDRTVVAADVAVRLCHDEDLRRLEWFGLYSHHRQIFDEAFARQLRDENIMLVADLHGFPIGQAWIDLTKRQAEAVGYIWAVRVFPFLRNMGIGTLLMRAAERVLSGRAISVAEVGVEQSNPQARRLYERLGYTMYTQLTEEYGYTTPEGVHTRQVVDQWILRKRLDGPPTDRQR
jgi:ribosomal protein S18 acetylase RimI-like enzyme